MKEVKKILFKYDNLGYTFKTILDVDEPDRFHTFKFFIHNRKA